MRRSGKGRGITINGGGTSKTNAWKMLMSAASEGLPVRKWKPYKVPKAMLDAEARANEYMRLPSLIR